MTSGSGTDQEIHSKIQSAHPEMPGVWLPVPAHLSSRRTKPLRRPIPGSLAIARFSYRVLRFAGASEANRKGVTWAHARRGSIGADAKSIHEQTQSSCDR